MTGNLLLCVSKMERTAFRSLVEESKICTHLCFAVYDKSGKRIKQTNQKSDDKNYGTVTMQLDADEYQLVVLAHSSTKNPAMTNPEKIQFNNSIGVTDTYLCHMMITIRDEPQTIDVVLRHVVACCRFVIEGEIPQGVSTLRFDYKGGSMYLSAPSGYGVSATAQNAIFAAKTGQTMTEYEDEQRLNLFDPNMINTTKHIWPITVTTDRYRGGFCEV